MNFYQALDNHFRTGNVDGINYNKYVGRTYKYNDTHTIKIVAFEDGEFKVENYKNGVKAMDTYHKARYMVEDIENTKMYERVWD